MALTKSDLHAIETLLLPIHGRLDKMDGRLDKMDGRLDKMERHQNKTDRRLEKLESDVSALKCGQLDIMKELKNMDRKISDTYQLALDAWGTGVENRKWLEQL